MKIDREILYRYFDNRATEEEEKCIRAYIEASEDNWRDYLAERKMFDRLLLNAPSRQVKRSFLRRITFRDVLSIAAMIAVIMLTAYIWLQQPEPGMPTVVATENGQMAQVQLPDGTLVKLNANTHLKYPEHFSGLEREVTVEGEAYFEVTPDEHHPFVVNTSRLKVRVLGTKFYVEDYRNCDYSQVSLMQGKVEVASGNQVVALLPHQQAILRDNRLGIQPIEDFDVYRWREGLICVKNRSISEIVEIFEKYFGVHIQIATALDETRSITGKFRISDGVEYALEVLLFERPYKYKRDAEKNMIIIY